jgi:hypothetical protein
VSDESDPVRWSVDGPPGAAELVRALDRPPPLPPDLRGMLRRRIERPPAPRAPRWVGPTALATAVVVGGLVLWTFDRPPPEPVVAPSLAPDAEPRAGVLPTERPAPPARTVPPGPAVTPERAPPPSSSVPPQRGRRSPWPTPPDVVAPDGVTAPPVPAGRVAGYGSLMIQTLPWARVYIDGRDTGRNTPVRGMSVPAGMHRIGLRPPDGVMYELTVEVRAGETVRIVRQL